MVKIGFVAGALALLSAAPAIAQTPMAKPVKLGVVTDMSGSLSAQSGIGSVVAAEMAREDCLAGPCKGMSIEIVSADHQNKPDLAVAIVKKWVDVDGVDAVTDIIQGAVQIAVQHLMADKHRIALFPGGVASLHQEHCAPATSVQWMWDSYGQAAGITRPTVKPGSKWFFIIPDYAFGISVRGDAGKLVEQLGGKVIGEVRHPFNFAGDFSSFLLQAQSSGADVIAIASTGGDLVNVLKQAHEFNIGSEKQQVVSFTMTLPDVFALGLPTAQGGLVLTEGFYWDIDERTRAFSNRFLARQKAMPSQIQAGVYSVSLHYLRAVAAAGTTETDAVMRKIHELPVGDAVIHTGNLRVDGRMEHDTYLFRVKTPAESRAPYDFYQMVATTKAADAFGPLSDSICPLLKKG